MVSQNSYLRDVLTYPRFSFSSCKIVILDSGYLAVAECARGLEKLGHKVFPIALGEDFIKRLLNLLVTVKPDFLLTVNHLGFDEEGKLTDLLTELGIPFASWYVDSPTYVLKNDRRNVSDCCVMFCWDSWYLEAIEAMGFSRPVCLPLATDPDIFKPLGKSRKGNNGVQLSFVGNSMEQATKKWSGKFSPHRFATIKEKAVFRQLDARQMAMSDILKNFEGIETDEFLDMEAALVWESTQTYRLKLVKALLPLGLVIYGDDGWRGLLDSDTAIRPQVDYYRQLPRVFNGTAVNINATSMQMKRTVNQRVFDVAACGSFLLTDRMSDMDDFFEPGTESVCYDTIDEAVSLAAYYLGKNFEREKIAKAARKRVLADHTYEKRMSVLVAHMRERFL